MITTNLSEKERKIRKNLRIKEVIEGKHSLFYPQIKKLGFWVNMGSEYWFLENAKAYIDQYIAKRLKKREVIYHSIF